MWEKLSANLAEANFLNRLISKELEYVEGSHRYSIREEEGATSRGI